MAYTVISVFPATVDTEEVKNNLRNLGFNDANVVVSKSAVEDESSYDGYEDDEKTKSFWDYVFAHDVELLDAYSKQSVGKSNIVVYADNFEEAQRAKVILNERGALKVFRKDSPDTAKKDTAGLPEDVYNGIIAKAKHNIYFLGSERNYNSPNKGMDDEMDSLGSKD